MYVTLIIKPLYVTSLRGTPTHSYFLTVGLCCRLPRTTRLRSAARCWRRSVLLLLWVWVFGSRPHLLQGNHTFRGRGEQLMASRLHSCLGLL